MPIRATALLSLALAVLLAAAASAQARLPRDFFGIVPQTPINEEDTNRMRHGGVDVVRLPMTWPSIQAAADADFDWSGMDEAVALIARSRLGALPVLYGTPRWLGGRHSNLPVSNARQRRAWSAFLRAAVERYGPGGQFWLEHWRGSGDFVPRRPIRKWQIWNEENFFYFTTPASPGRYARLLKVSRRAINQADPRTEIIIGGLFGDPKGRPPKAMDAVDFLDRLYRVPGIKRSFDGVALHPYAANVRTLAGLASQVRRAMLRHGDRRTGLYLTELGWGSKRNPRRVAFEVGLHEQARELRRAYTYLIRNRRRLNLKQVHWFTWKDVAGSCGFCDSSGLFRRGSRFRPKPAWHMFSAVARGRVR